MIDSFNREINYLRISVTDRCNLRCRYCMPKEGLSLIGHDDILRYEEIMRVVESAVRLGVIKVRITGGEPLVRRNLLGFLKNLGGISGLREVTLTTNGLLLEDFADGLYESGVRRINVSLDSLKPEKYEYITRGGDLNKVLKGISRARQAGLSPIKINVVVLEGFNDDEITDFAALTLDHPYQVRFIELMSLGRITFDDRMGYVSNEKVMERIRTIYSLDPVERGSKSDGPAAVYRIRGAQGEIGFISSGTRHLCQSCNRLRLTAEGHLRACLFSDEEFDLKDSLRSGCSDADLDRMIMKVITGKSESRGSASQERGIRKCAKEMFSIGG